MHFVPPLIFNWLEPNYPMYNLKLACCCLPKWSSLVIMKSAVFIRGISLHHSQCRDMSKIKQASAICSQLSFFEPHKGQTIIYCCTPSAVAVFF